jgi:hypothetical protein
MARDFEALLSNKRILLQQGRWWSRSSRLFALAAKQTRTFCYVSQNLDLTEAVLGSKNAECPFAKAPRIIVKGEA